MSVKYYPAVLKVKYRRQVPGFERVRVIDMTIARKG
jgi:hypothetical protein